jgi:PIN domain nuclease of toxin-antitoxin system
VSLDAAVVADTHAFIWYLRDDDQLSARAAAAMDAASEAGRPIFISAVTVVELRYLVEKDTLNERDFDAFTRVLTPFDSAFEIAPVGFEVATAVGRVPRDAVRDPWDRMIAATAISLDLPLVTRDRKLSALKLPTIW